MSTSHQISPEGDDVFAHARLQVEAADAGVRFLAEAGEALAASLDREATLVRVAHLAIPTLADWCIVDVLESDGATIHQVAVAAVDPAKEGPAARDADALSAVDGLAPAGRQGAAGRQGRRLP